MYRLLEFLRSIYVFAIFLLLEGAAIYVYATSDSYSQAKAISYTSRVTGGVGDVVGSVADYFRLRRENDDLLGRIVELEERLSHYERYESDSLRALKSYEDGLGVYYQAARVVSNSINKQHNYLVVNVGLQDDVRSGMAVVTPSREMVGVVVECGDHFSVVMTMLNRRFQTSGEILGDNEYAGSISWGGVDRYQMKMKELSKYAPISEGATVVSTGFSQVFPAGVTIGTVANYELDPEGRSYSANIVIAAHLSALRDVLIVNDRTNVEASEILDAEFYNVN